MAERKKMSTVNKGEAAGRLDMLLGERREFIGSKDFKALEQWMLGVEDVLKYLFVKKKE